jgi:hypothetical protein
MGGVEYWRDGALEYWSGGVLEYWSDGGVVSWAQAAAGKRIAAKRHKDHKRAKPPPRTELWRDRIIEGAALREYLSA